MNEYEIFPVSAPLFVDVDRTKNRRPQCTSIFILPPFPSPSLFPHSSRTTWSLSRPIRSFGGTATSDFVPFCSGSQDSSRYEWIRTRPSLIKLSSYCPSQRCSTSRIFSLFDICKTRKWSSLWELQINGTCQSYFEGLCTFIFLIRDYSRKFCFFLNRSNMIFIFESYYL